VITPFLQSEIERELKCRIVAIAPLSAANNAQIYRLSCDDRKVYVAKVAERGLDIEAFMLRYLKDKSKLPVPRVFFSNEHIIIMEFFVAQMSLDDASQRNAAELLADLHKIRADKYGFERDTLIGFLRQPNEQSGDWTAFFVKNRLMHMGEEALKERKIDAKFMKQLERLCAKMGRYITQPQPPSLIHGDIWGGNILSGNGRIAAFLDPAIYYADPEIELAFIRLFHTFSDSFYARYNEINPIRPGFYEERADIYSLYPLLVHTRLFGLSYARKAQKILDRFS
jgi:fructosamine-3-kinase